MLFMPTAVVLLALATGFLVLLVWSCCVVSDDPEED